MNNEHSYQSGLLSHDFRKELSGFDTADWQRLVTDMLAGLPIPLNIDFSDYDPRMRINELYDILVDNNVNTGFYKSAIVQLLLEYYPEYNRILDIYYLVLAVDHIRPSLYFDRLLLLVVKPEYAFMVDVEGPDHISINFRLANAIMYFDLDRKLFAWLMSLKDQPQRWEYYQVAIRYLYSYCGKPEFNKFMTAVYPHFIDLTIRTTVLRTLREYLFYNKEFSLLTGWLQLIIPQITTDLHSEAFELLADNVTEWLETEKDDLHDKKGYEETYWYLYPFIKQEQYQPPVVEHLYYESEADFYDKPALISYVQSYVLQPVPSQFQPSRTYHKSDFRLPRQMVIDSITAPPDVDRHQLYGIGPI